MLVAEVVAGILEIILDQVEMEAAVLALNMEFPMELLAQPILVVVGAAEEIRAVALMILAQAALAWLLFLLLLQQHPLQALLP